MDIRELDRRALAYAEEIVAGAARGGTVSPGSLERSFEQCVTMHRYAIRDASEAGPC